MDTATLTAIEEIRRLKHVYAAACDRGYDPDGMTPLFTDDAVWDGGVRFGRHEGLEAIRRFFAGVSSEIVWALHYMLNPVIDVAEDHETATAAGTSGSPVRSSGRKGRRPCG